MNNSDKNEQTIPSADNSALFGTTSSDIVEGLHQNAFPQSSSDTPEEDDQIVNAQDQQEIVNPTQEPSAEESVTLQHLPGIEKDLFDKNMMEEKELPGDEDSNDIEAN